MSDAEREQRVALRDFTTALRRLRRRRGLSLAGLHDLTGIKLARLRLMQQGYSEPRLADLRLLARALGVPVCELLGDAPHDGAPGSAPP
jgi:XRE family transcriptional regulator, fatty acid utilization regulator